MGSARVRFQTEHTASSQKFYRTILPICQEIFSFACKSGFVHVFALPENCPLRLSGRIRRSVRISARRASSSDAGRDPIARYNCHLYAMCALLEVRGPQGLTFRPRWQSLPVFPIFCAISLCLGEL